MDGETPAVPQSATLRAMYESAEGSRPRWREAISDANVAEQLAGDVCAYVRPFLDTSTIAELAGLYSQRCFRRTITMRSWAYGEGEYKYFDYPLPDDIQVLREMFYRCLAPCADEWAMRLGFNVSYPASLNEFLEECRSKGQDVPTPLMLNYSVGGYNGLHRDIYGKKYFPFQVVLGLSQHGVDYEGGEFVLVEEAEQGGGAVATAVAVPYGGAIVFPTRWRAARTRNGRYVRSAVKHGVSEVRGGSRTTLGLIFHDAEK